jgi:hypothetical protein
MRPHGIAATLLRPCQYVVFLSRCVARWSTNSRWSPAVPSTVLAVGSPIAVGLWLSAGLMLLLPVAMRLMAWRKPPGS